MISIDPGVEKCGVAYWDGDDLGTVDYRDSNNAPYAAPGEVVVIELPQVYVASRSKGNPNNLIKLAVTVGTLCGQFTKSAKIELVQPRRWKGTIQKHQMLKRILSKLKDRELAMLKALKLPKSSEHNVIDAIGLGLWKLGRL